MLWREIIRVFCRQYSRRSEQHDRANLCLRSRSQVITLRLHLKGQQCWEHGHQTHSARSCSSKTWLQIENSTGRKLLAVYASASSRPCRHQRRRRLYITHRPPARHQGRLRHAIPRPLIVPSTDDIAFRPPGGPGQFRMVHATRFPPKSNC